jgi:phosphoglycerate dehydrogenase-like enzyme
MMSQRALDRWSSRVFQASHGHELELISLEEAVRTQRRDLDAAFVSRDVTANSTKHQVEPVLQACHDLLLANEGLRWVHIHSAGADRPAYIKLHGRGVAVTTSSGANAQVVAATALGGILALARRFPMLWAQQQRREWKALLGPDRMPRDLSGQSATVLGWGPIAQGLAPLLQALGLKVTAIRTHAAADAQGVRMRRYADLAEVIPATDWLVLACPLTPQTRQLVDAALLAALPAGAQVVNVARGEVVDEAALIQALQSGRLGGAFLDVFAHEPLPQESPLWSLPQVIVTPHAAGHSDGNEDRVGETFLDNLQRWWAGEPLRNQVA